MTEITLPGIIPDIFKIIIGFINPWKFIIINKEFKKYFYHRLISYLKLYSVHSWNLILPSSINFKGELLEIKNNLSKKLSNISSKHYIRFLEKTFLKLPENFFSILNNYYPAEESIKIFNLCGHLLSYKQLLVLPIILKNGCSLTFKQNEIIPILPVNIDTVFTNQIQIIKKRICDVIFGPRGIINSQVYIWPNKSSEFIKCLFIMHLDLMGDYRLTINPRDYPEWVDPLIKYWFEQKQSSFESEED